MHQILSSQGRTAMDGYISRLAELNHISGFMSSAAQFAINVDPRVQQTAFQKAQESNEFLKRINMQLVNEIRGQRLGLGTFAPAMKRTNTSSHDRTPRDLSNSTEDTYECKSTEFDTFLSWNTIDNWSWMPNFQEIIQNSKLETFGNNLQMVGFFGTSAATETDIVANPNLEDVNIGWLEQIRQKRPLQVFDGIPAVDPEDPDAPLYFGSHASNEYKNIDAMVKDAANSLLPNWARSAPMVAICGHAVSDDKSLSAINKVQSAQDVLAAEVIANNQKIGGYPAFQVPYMPENTILLTPFNNLSIYQQRGTQRRVFESNHKRSREEEYNSSNIAYVVEDFDYALLIENFSERNAA